MTVSSATLFTGLAEVLWWRAPLPPSHLTPFTTVINSRFTQSSRSGVQETFLSSICREIKVDTCSAGINQRLFPILRYSHIVASFYLTPPSHEVFCKLLNVTPSNFLITKVLHAVVGSHHHGSLFAFSHVIKNMEAMRSWTYCIDNYPHHYRAWWVSPDSMIKEEGSTSHTWYIIDSTGGSGY